MRTLGNDLAKVPMRKRSFSSSTVWKDIVKIEASECRIVLKQRNENNAGRENKKAVIVEKVFPQDRDNRRQGENDVRERVETTSIVNEFLEVSRFEDNSLEVRIFSFFFCPSRIEPNFSVHQFQSKWRGNATR